MSTSKKQKPRSGARPRVAIEEVRDLVDFHRRWLDFRNMAIELSEEPLLTASQRDIMIWLIHLADRVGPKDFGPSV
jgi:hypothetical protein